MKYSRARLEIVYDIMTFIQNQRNGAMSTHILFKANLSPTLLRKYMDTLMDDKLVKVDLVNGKKYYFVTDHGHKFLRLLAELDKMTKVFNLPKENRKF
jgi:predicted transcriptional regulator